jgi:hypothetical protein
MARLPMDNRGFATKTVCLVAGSALGALIRSLMTLRWFWFPLQLLVATTGAVLASFALVGLVLASEAGPNVRAFVVGTSATMASVSAYIGIGVSRSGWIGAAFLIVTPAAVLIGLVAGGILGVLAKRVRRHPRRWAHD